MHERVSAADFKAMQEAESKPDKGRVRGTKRITIQGVKFDSLREANYWLKLRQQQKDGDIRDLRLQVPFDLLGKNGPILTPTGRTMTYRADFVFFDVKQGRERILDAKGWQTDVSTLKIAIMAAQGFRVELV